MEVTEELNILQRENGKISDFFNMLADSCDCEGCNPPLNKSPRLNIHGDIFKRDFARYTQLLQNKIRVQQQTVDEISSKLKSKTSIVKSVRKKKKSAIGSTRKTAVPRSISKRAAEELKTLRKLQEKLKSAQNYLPPKFVPPVDLPSSKVPLSVLESEIGFVKRIVSRPRKNNDITVINSVEDDIVQLKNDGGLLYKFKDDDFAEEDQGRFWEKLSKMRHDDTYGRPKKRNQIRISIGWTRISLAKEFIYQCDQYVPLSFANLDPKGESGELIKLTVGDVTEMMRSWFPLCQKNPLRATVQFFSRLRNLCEEQGGELHIPYVVIAHDIKLSGDSSLGFDFDNIPTVLNKAMQTKIPGINTAYSYLAILGSFFTLHAEDSNLNSMSMHFGGLPKVWVIMNGKQTKVVHARLHQELPADAAGKTIKQCLIQHKSILVDPEQFRKWGVKFKYFVHTPGCVIFTGSGCLHQGVNTGNGVAKAANLAFQDILEHGTMEDRVLSDCHCSDEENQKCVLDDITTYTMLDLLRKQALEKPGCPFESAEEIEMYFQWKRRQPENLHLCTHEICQNLLSQFAVRSGEIEVSVVSSETGDSVISPAIADSSQSEPEHSTSRQSKKNQEKHQLNFTNNGMVQDIPQVPGFQVNATVNGPTIENRATVPDGASVSENPLLRNQEVANDETSASNVLRNILLKPVLLSSTIANLPSVTLHHGKHQRRINWTEVPYDNGYYKCALCPKAKLKSKKSVRDHLREVHFKDPNQSYTCETCGRTFKSRRACKNHHVEKHTDASYPCERCKLVFSTVYNRCRHRKDCKGPAQPTTVSVPAITASSSMEEDI